jgi:hypothetical protein
VLALSLAAAAQQSYFSKRSVDSLVASGDRPQSANPFTRPESSSDSTTSEADSLGVQFEGPRIVSAASFAFVAPPEFYLPRRDQGLAGPWSSALTGSVARFVTPGETTYVRFTGDFELFGQRRLAEEAANSGGQTMTLEWELAHLVDSRLGALEFSAGAYRQRTILFPSAPNGPISDVLLGYSGFGSGFETSVRLPDRNLSLTLRFGNERLSSTTQSGRIKAFELSWTW